MEVISSPMNSMYALEILNWKYDPPYDLYNSEINEDSLQELLENPYKAIVGKDEVLIGFYCAGNSAHVPAGRAIGAYQEKCIDVGFGMKPELTGQGNGKLFLSFILSEISQLVPNCPIRLTVAAFNKRAIRLYKNMGFKEEKEFANEKHTFITMIKS